MYQRAYKDSIRGRIIVHLVSSLYFLIVNVSRIACLVSSLSVTEEIAVPESIQLPVKLETRLTVILPLQSNCPLYCLLL